LAIHPDLRQHDVAARLLSEGTQAMTQRRTFMLHVALCSTTAMLASHAHAAPPMVDEKDPKASALGYRADASHVDKAKFPKYSAGEDCASCSLFKGNPSDAAGGCPLFPGMQVAGAGWCSAYQSL
jgi:hypothetical protein